MTNAIDTAALAWFKSSKSSANGQCTMCARLPNGDMAVKDSKDPHGPVLLFSATEWQAFTRNIKHDDLN